MSDPRSVSPAPPASNGTPDEATPDMKGALSAIDRMLETEPPVGAATPLARPGPTPVAASSGSRTVPPNRPDQKSAAARDARPQSGGTPASATAARSRLYWFLGTADLNPLDPGSLTYEPYFGLREKPFSLLSDPRFFFGDSVHGAAFETLVGGICRREGIMALTGEVGTGKTTLCRAVLQSLDRRAFAAFVPDPFLSREDLLKTLLLDFGVVSMDEVRSGRLRGASRADLSFPLYEFLASLQPLKAFAVVMIDEAQNLTSELLEEIRILADLEGRQKLVQVFLVGQPELRERLTTPQMRQLRQRMTVQCELVPLAGQEVAQYIAHRLEVAGGDGRGLFSLASIDLIRTASNGIPRVINLLCDRALSRAASLRATRVEADDVVWAAEELRLPTPDRWRAEIRVEPRSFRPPDPPGGQSQPAAPALHVVQPFLLPSPAETPVPREASDTAGESADGESSVRLDAIDEAFERLAEAPELQPVEPEGEPAAPSHAGDAADTSGADQAQDASGESAPAAETRALDAPVGGDLETAIESFEPEPVNATPPLLRRYLWIAGACLAFATGFGGYLYLSASESSQDQPTIEAAVDQAQPVPESIPLPADPAASTASPAEPVRPAASPSPVPDLAAPPVGSATPAGPAGPVALQMATFQSAVRAQQAVDELRAAGFDARSIPVSLRDGQPAIVVMLGPFPDVPTAERELARAQQIPGYDTARVVPVGSSR